MRPGSWADVGAPGQPRAGATARPERTGRGACAVLYGGLGICVALLYLVAAPLPAAAPGLVVQEYAVPAGSHPHDAVPDRLGGVWYVGQRNGTAGRLDPATGDIVVVPLGTGSAPRGHHGP